MPDDNNNLNSDKTIFWKSTLSDFQRLSPLPAEQPGNIKATKIGLLEFPFSEFENSDILLPLAWFILLSRYSEQKDILFGLCSADAGNQILPFRLHLDEEQSIASLISEFKNQARCIQKNSAPLSEILTWAELPTDCVLFESAITIGDQTHRHIPISISLTSKSKLQLQYDASRFAVDNLRLVVKHLQTIAENLRDKPDMTVSKIDFLTPDEKQKILSDWNATSTRFPQDKCLHELFEEQALARSEAIALTIRDRTLSYQALERQANQVANYLQKSGVGPDVLVGVCMERSLEMVIALFGVLKAGGAYVPIDPQYPRERVVLMLEDTAAPVLLTQQHLRDKLPAHKTKVIAIDADWRQIKQESPLQPKTGVTPENLAYTIFTSGSTGKPKGAVLNHRGRVNNFSDFNRRYRVKPGDKVVGLASLSFDMSAYDIFGILMAGGTVVLVEQEGALDPARWASLMLHRDVTIWHSVPALLEMYVSFLDQNPTKAPKKLRLVLLGGDWIPVNLPDRLKSHVKNVQVVSMGGATECSMDSTIYDITASSSGWKSIPYGVPMANQLSYVLDHYLRPAPVGVAGELYLGGIGVGRGYHNRQKLTAEKFVPNPFSGVAGDRMYRTGDLARRLPDGNLELLGRIDFQVKVRGFRVELGEIEQALFDNAGVARSVVKVVQRPSADGAFKDPTLIAYVVPKEGVHLDEKQMQSVLSERLPHYMVPSLFIVLDSLPLSANGKTDRKSLPEPDFSNAATPTKYVSPKNKLQKKLVAIWQKALGIKRIGIDDIFFEIGGTSLLAVKTAITIRKRLRKSILPDLLLACPTIRELAIAIETAKSKPGHSAIEAMQPHGDNPPFFMIPGVFSGIRYLNSLTRLLSDNQPFYGVRPQDLHFTEPPLMTIEEIAARLIPEIRAVQPDGPFYLGGHSFGCTVAFEMAQQLRKNGHEVNLLLFFDYVDATIDPEPNRKKKDRIKKGLFTLLHKTGLPHWICRRNRTKNQTTSAFWQRLLYIPQINLLAEQTYKATRYDGEITLFRANETDFPDKQGLLEMAKQPVKVYNVPGDHDSLVKEPVVAALLEKCVGDNLKSNLPAD